VQRTQPWKFKSSRAPLSRAIQFHAAEVIRLAGIMAQPFMPIKASEMLDMIGVDPRRRSLQWASFAKDYNYGITKPGSPLYLFPRLEQPPNHPSTPEELEAIRESRRAAGEERRRAYLISVGRDPDAEGPRATGNTVKVNAANVLMRPNTSVNSVT
jgi:hypothetical protein